MLLVTYQQLERVVPSQTLMLLMVALNVLKGFQSANLEETDYAGYDCDNWVERGMMFHTLKAIESKNSNAKQA